MSSSLAPAAPAAVKPADKAEPAPKKVNAPQTQQEHLCEAPRPCETGWTRRVAYARLRSTKPAMWTCFPPLVVLLCSPTHDQSLPHARAFVFVFCSGGCGRTCTCPGPCRQELGIDGHFQSPRACPCRPCCPRACTRGKDGGGVPPEACPRCRSSCYAPSSCCFACCGAQEEGREVCSQGSPRDAAACVCSGV